MMLYERMEKPFSKRKDLDQIIMAYTLKSSMYTALTHSNQENKVKGFIRHSDKDAFYLQIFNDWKKTINTLVTKNMIKKEYVQQAYTLNNYLLTVHPTTAKEVLQIMDPEEISIEPLKSAMETFRWNKIGEYSGWDHIHSNYVNYCLSKKQKIKHRLYINCDSTEIYKFMTKFIQKCNQYKQSYYFKFDEPGTRDDCIVIFSDTEHLERYIKIINEIIREEHLEKSMHKPPVCTGKIDGYIGYGTDPENEGHKTSFNKKRSIHLESCINEETSNWIQRNLETRFKLNGKETTYKEYLINKIVKTTKEKYLIYVKDTEASSQVYGFTLSDLKNSNVDSIIRKEIEINFNQVLEYFKTSKLTPIKIPFMKGFIKIDGFILSNVKQEQVGFIYKNSERYRNDLQNRILSTAKDFGIDKDNYGCDLYVVEELGKKTKKSITNVKVTPNATTETPKKTNTTPRRGRMLYKPMTDDEIEETRRKLGFI